MCIAFWPSYIICVVQACQGERTDFGVSVTAAPATTAPAPEDDEIEPLEEYNTFVGYSTTNGSYGCQ